MARSNFHLNKWFLDFIGDKGEAMIFYAAKLTWNGFSAHYASWIQYDSENGVKVSSHFRNVIIPKKKEKLISWHDDKFKVSGQWESVAKPLQARIYDADHGFLDWNCFQPASKVKLNIGDKVVKGNGYVEQLILTAPPWHIPMNDLRWGRFHSLGNTIVWIELRAEKQQQWIWLNGEKITNCSIEDNCLSSDERAFSLKLDRGVVIESEKKIHQVVHKLLRYLPGFNKLMPTKFLMAESHKWVSKGEFQKNGSPIMHGMAIHEWVDFNLQDQ